MRILLLHGYSAANLGDGLLVEESLRCIYDAFGEDSEISVFASHPETFSHLGVTVLDSGLSRRGYDMKYLRSLFQLRKSFDVLVAVGGGYLRFGTPIEALKTMLIHGPQLVAASFSRVPSIYMPQSIGPLRFGSRRPVQQLLKRCSVVALRDDRSVQEVGSIAPVRRVPDLALISGSTIEPSLDEPLAKAVLSVRDVKGKVPDDVMELSSLLSDYDVYVQSRTGGNDDTRATESLGTHPEIDKTTLLENGPTRVIIAVRLHAALMALRAGHFVIHLAYERKGFGAFDDLGLNEFVHNVNDFDASVVLKQAQALMKDKQARESYAQQIEKSVSHRRSAYSTLVTQMKHAGSSTTRI
ncbi:polysaccharide pyruvyl transferase family protein [Glutamicibacter mishrai]|uniref:Polysaccharide pyruvyl transferase family protein n=1 Tax=Glutamicibacter mishrai TaxID=1775880 RepID=A0A6H0SJ66_9MICC|nr:polysaccharide pyruvyl transferase family protein [Glutamicibacter mishrai]QIV86459.1 polysaccharide pyruvyl transferase family protein [Glutamicibacter mishrai]